MKIRMITIVALLMGAFAMAGCGKDQDKGTAAFKVQLNNSAASSLMSAGRTNAFAVATSLTAKLGGVDLLRDCWSADGASNANCDFSAANPDPDIWVNAGCNGDIAQCTTANTQFFELIDPSAANATLNSQGRSIEVGTFTHVRVYFLNNDNGDAIKCDNVASAARPAIPLVVKLSQAVTVAAGESVTVTLNYNPSSLDCSVSGSIESVISPMTATVTKN